jgi:hypothetical protein
MSKIGEWIAKLIKGEKHVTFDSVVEDWYKTARTNIKKGKVPTIPSDKIKGSMELVKKVSDSFYLLPMAIRTNQEKSFLIWMEILDSALSESFLTEFHLRNVLVDDIYFHKEKDQIKLLEYVLSKINYL